MESSVALAQRGELFVASKFCPEAAGKPPLSILRLVRPRWRSSEPQIGH